MRIFSVVFLMMFSLHLEAKGSDTPKEFATIDEVRAWVLTGTGFGVPEFFETDLDRAKIFVGWYDPFSGRSAEYAYAYVFSRERQKWLLLDESFIDKGGPISYVYVDKNAGQIVYVDDQGKKFKKVALPKDR